MFRRRWVGWQAATGLLAQVTQGAGAVGTILVIKQHGGSLGLAGVTVGALSIAAGIARPIQGRLIDRRGSAPVMAVCGVVHPAALVAIVALSAAGAQGILLVLAGIAAGIALPPVSTSMRVVWGEAVGDAERMSAYSLTYLVQELSILLGPLLLAAMIALFSASAAVVVVAVLAGAATLGYAASVRSHGRGIPADAASRRGVFGSVAVRLLVTIALLLGGVIGGIEVAAPAFAIAHRVPAAGALLIAAVSVGGIIGATVYGNRRWGVAPGVRLVVLLGALALAMFLAAVAASAVEVAAVLVLGGACLNPALTTISLLVDEHTPGRTAAEAFGWLSTGFAAGGGVASAIAGVVAGRHGGAAPAFLVAAVSGGLAVGVAALARARFVRGSDCEAM